MNLKNELYNSSFTVSYPMIYFSNSFLKKFIGFELYIRIIDFFFYIHRIFSKVNSINQNKCKT